MVLEEATASPTDSFAQDAPTSDIDPYSSDTTDLSPNSSSPLRVDVSKLPKIWGILGPASMDNRQANMLGEHLKTITGILNRPLSQPEVDALSYHFARGMQVSSYSIPVGLAAGAFQAVRTRDAWTFPFWKPQDTSWFNPDKFGPLSGPRARFMWRSLRIQAYGFVGVVAAGLFFSAYSVSVTTQGRTTDPRLKDFNEVVLAKMRDYRQNGLPQQQQARIGQNNPIGTKEGQMDNQIQQINRRVEQMKARSQSRPAAQQDDMSPTSASWAEGDSPATDTGLMSDSQTRRRERRQEADYDTSPTENRASTFDMEKVTSQPQGFDDMSPQSSPQSRPATQYPTGSVWERLRREASQGKGQSQDRGAGKTAGWGGVQREQQREQQQGSTLGDSFTFSSSDEERQLAKNEAQNEFDARVERERQGGDFEEGRRGRKW